MRIVAYMHESANLLLPITFAMNVLETQFSVDQKYEMINKNYKKLENRHIVVKL